MFTLPRILQFLTLVMMTGFIAACTTTKPAGELPELADLAQIIETEYGGDANLYNKKVLYEVSFFESRQPFLEYAVNRRVDLLNILKDYGWDPNVPIAQGHSTAISQVVRHSRSAAALESLLAVGADLSNLCYTTPAAECPTALAMATLMGSPDMLRVILDNTETPIWRAGPYVAGRENQRLTVTGDAAIQQAIKYYRKNEKSDGFAQAFRDLGYGEMLQTAQAQRHQSGGGGSWRQDLMAMGAGAALGAAIVGEGDFLGSLDVGTASEFMDVFADSGMMGSTPGQATAQPGAAGNTGTATAGNATGGQTFSIDEMYRPTCPDGRRASRDVPIKTNLPACAAAMRTYARVASCNLFEEHEAAEKAYYRECASEIFR